MFLTSARTLSSTTKYLVKCIELTVMFRGNTCETVSLFNWGFVKKQIKYNKHILKKKVSPDFTVLEKSLQTLDFPVFILIQKLHKIL